MGKVMLVYVPYDSGKAGERYGRGPLVAREAGLTARIAKRHEVTETVVVHSGNFATEGNSAFDLAHSIAAIVSQAPVGKFLSNRDWGELQLVAGNRIRNYRRSARCCLARLPRRLRYCGNDYLSCPQRF